CRAQPVPFRGHPDGHRLTEKFGQAFGGSVLTKARLRSTHEASSCSVLTPSGATVIHPSIVRPRISTREAWGRARAESGSAGSIRARSPPLRDALTAMLP